MTEGSQSPGRSGEQLFCDSEITVYFIEHHSCPQGYKSQAEIF